MRRTGPDRGQRETRVSSNSNCELAAAPAAHAETHTSNQLLYSSLTCHLDYVYLRLRLTLTDQQQSAQ
jgi:hypothetical protein